MQEGYFFVQNATLWYYGIISQLELNQLFNRLTGMTPEYLPTKRRRPMLPEKKSKKWLNVFLIYAAIVFLGFVATRMILGSEINGRMIFMFALTAFGSALLPALAGYYGKMLFFMIYTSANLIGLLYMFKLVLMDSETGWADLTSVVVYIYLLPVGAFLALLAEVISYFRRNKNK